ncbi:hypothetical protein [Phenylobacterium sp.]|jgi:predicted benzoate:H+ symporter BenE|uniref:hypothetical protein n=1 Tax=Phenylobacterium sp. TaxID=1871053 RepID=UPI002E312D8D|nr:hypothetical protein [Phenylobacterium sp.]HEX3365334.1 hypothetical protein [Phenylobacterium sp.]
MSDAQSDPTKRFFGAALTAIGGLVFALCGLCTGVFLITGLMPHEDHTLSGIALVAGGIPSFTGFVVMRFGLKIYREASPNPDISHGSRLGGRGLASALELS